MISHNSLDTVSYQGAGGKTSDRIYELLEVTGKMKNSYPFVILNFWSIM